MRPLVTHFYISQSRRSSSVFKQRVLEGFAICNDPLHPLSRSSGRSRAELIVKVSASRNCLPLLVHTHSLPLPAVVSHSNLTFPYLVLYLNHTSHLLCRKSTPGLRPREAGAHTEAAEVVLAEAALEAAAGSLSMAHPTTQSKLKSHSKIKASWAK